MLSLLLAQLLASGPFWDGITVFSGDRPEPFKVEVLDVLPQGIGVEVPLYLVRLHGERIEHTGVIAGMSGSPVYRDGKLMGAVGYRIGSFAREPIGGVTPIEAMRLAARGGTSTAHSARAAEAIALPLVVGGLDAAAAAPLVKTLDALSPVSLRSAVGGGRGGEAPDQLIDGGAIAVVMAHGDINIFGVGTVTEVKDGNFLAFGHPMFGWGDVAVPVATAWISTTIASPLNAFKVGRMGKLVGTMTQDRLPAIAGTIGPIPKMLPMTATFGATKPLRVDLIKDRRITPALVGSVAQHTLNQRIGRETGGTVRLDVAIDTDRGPLTLEHWAVHPHAASLTAEAITPLTTIVQLLQDNPIAPIDLRRIELKLSRRPEVHHAQLRGLEVLNPRPRVGTQLELRLRWRGYQNGDRFERVALPLPAELAEGEAEVVVAAGSSIDTIEFLCGDDAEPSTAGQIVPWINSFARANQRTVFLIRRDRTSRNGSQRAMASAWAQALPRIDLDATDGFCRIVARAPLSPSAGPAVGELAQPIHLRGAHR